MIPPFAKVTVVSLEWTGTLLWERTGKSWKEFYKRKFYKGETPPFKCVPPTLDWGLEKDIQKQLCASLESDLSGSSKHGIAYAHYNAKQRRRKLDRSCKNSPWLRPSVSVNQDPNDKTPELGRAEGRSPRNVNSLEWPN